MPYQYRYAVGATAVNRRHRCRYWSSFDWGNVHFLGASTPASPHLQLHSTSLPFPSKYIGISSDDIAHLPGVSIAVGQRPSRSSQRAGRTAWGSFAGPAHDHAVQSPRSIPTGPHQPSLVWILYWWNCLVYLPRTCYSCRQLPPWLVFEIPSIFLRSIGIYQI